MEVRKYSPIRAEMNLVVMDAVETGLFTRWRQEQLPMEAFLDYNGLQVYDEKRPMNFRQLFLMLLFWLTGLTVAAIILGFESFRSRCKQRGKEQTNNTDDVPS